MIKRKRNGMIGCRCLFVVPPRCRGGTGWSQTRRGCAENFMGKFHLKKKEEKEKRTEQRNLTVSLCGTSLAGGAQPGLASRGGAARRGTDHPV